MIRWAQAAASASRAAGAGVQVNSRRRLGDSPGAAVSGNGPVMVTLDTRGSPREAR